MFLCLSQILRFSEHILHHTVVNTTPLEDNGKLHKTQLFHCNKTHIFKIIFCSALKANSCFKSVFSLKENVVPKQTFPVPQPIVPIHYF